MRFGDYELDLGRFELRRGSLRVRVQPKVLDLLVYLIRHRERVVPKEELLGALWEGVVVSETALTHAVKEARRAVRDDGVAQKVIQTVRGRGYRFVAPVEEPTERGPDEPFVGRATVLALLEQEFAVACGGRGRTVLLTGEPGIGKSRTAAEFAAYARGEGATVVVGRCPEGHAAPAHWPWTQVVRGVLSQRLVERRRDFSDEDAAVLAQGLAELRSELGAAGDASAPLADEQGRFRFSDTMARLLASAAAKRPLVLLLDDLHWADHSSLQLLEFLVRELAQAAILFVATYREAEVGRDAARARLLSAVTRSPGAHNVLLDGLSAADIAELAQALAGRLVPVSLAESLRDRTGGNPFFLTQILQLWESAEGEAGEAPVEPPLPQGMREAIGRHLDILGESARDMLSRASVVGRQFELDVVAHMSGVDVDAALEALESAVAARVVRPVGESWTRFEFAHALIPETLCEAMSAARRLRLHGRVGLALEALRGDDDARAGEIAHHFVQAAPLGHGEAAIDYSVRAARRATGQLAYQEAAAHYQRAVETLRFGKIDDAQRLELMLALAEAQGRVGDVADARKTFQQAAAIARELGDGPALARAALGLEWDVVRQGELSTDPLRVALLGEALGAVGPRESPLRVRLMAALDEALYFEEDAPLGPSLSGEAVEMARRLDDPDALVFALNRRHLLLRHPERLDERFAVSTELAHLARRRRDPDLVFDAYGSQIHDALEYGDVRLMDDALDAFERHVQEYKMPKYLWYADLYRAMRELLVGRFAEVEPRIERAFATGRRVQPDLARLWHVAQMQALRVDQGRASEFLPELREVAQLYPIPAMQFNLAICEALTGFQGPARRALDQLSEGSVKELRRDINWIVSVSVLAQLASLLRAPAAARTLYEQLLPFADQSIVIGTAIVYRGSVGTELGRLASLLERWNEADTFFERALARERAMGARPYVAWVEAQWAQSLLERGDDAARKQARELLGEAAAVAVEVGARFHHGIVKDLTKLAEA